MDLQGELPAQSRDSIRLESSGSLAQFGGRGLCDHPPYPQGDGIQIGIPASCPVQSTSPVRVPHPRCFMAGLI